MQVFNYRSFVETLSEHKEVVRLIKNDKSIAQMYCELFVDVGNARVKFNIKNPRAILTKFAIQTLSPSVTVRLNTLVEQLRAHHKIKVLPENCEA
ncbi:MAG: hypothetical protein COV32_00660 [Candidatus Yonathbacteria bacterium CG10_big_fil_rev_8_21_14_0_10_43_136]|uniref:Uncharacterized protein n=2 Tax=Parcubacteria group TaxID=1794811 RepID=A0A2M7Q5C4_9BACT|nr:MAG: hypothetical protein AUK15_01505 [Candidatus Nomurabacteria bacterium CG2_30_43_9]PIQ35692.1 MAG: hypothetical protein COW60_02690 [Candidatus Yonathbacteria bacterium CG17_big_fil_post_rev_8_21_14_2_50_43_9]PIR40946.1 MAG: hypothetical protein COV32_00660 [Candidatus Yonathbacteria bacterium CG10_big_fil_rev_8_21_14_0_10_43_136]PIX57398.1 MAG: hypothetical protein COZ48_00920 [Candidatus Yonathbacteria bacterium CG_4_10_14_3_um_filter_43_12]PIY58260.1 MAG: hypothetical protein COY98_02